MVSTGPSDALAAQRLQCLTSLLATAKQSKEQEKNERLAAMSDYQYFQNDADAVQKPGSLSFHRLSMLRGLPHLRIRCSSRLTEQMVVSLVSRYCSVHRSQSKLIGNRSHQMVFVWLTDASVAAEIQKDHHGTLVDGKLFLVALERQVTESAWREGVFYAIDRNWPPDSRAFISFSAKRMLPGNRQADGGIDWETYFFQAMQRYGMVEHVQMMRGNGAFVKFANKEAALRAVAMCPQDLDAVGHCGLAEAQQNPSTQARAPAVHAPPQPYLKSTPTYQADMQNSRASGDDLGEIGEPLPMHLNALRSVLEPYAQNPETVNQYERRDEDQNEQIINTLLQLLSNNNSNNNN